MEVQEVNKQIWILFMQEIQLESLKKGDFIAPEIVERVAGMDRTDYGYGFRQMELISRISDYFSDKGICITVKCERFGLRILTDSEACEYNSQIFKQRLKASFSAHRRMMGIDTNQLSETQRETYDRKLISQGKILQAISTANAEVKLLPYKRDKF